MYVHIPFCLRKCAYCDFNSYAGLGELFVPYIEALDREMALIAAQWPETALLTVFIGGGTPTALPTGHLARLLAAIQGRFHVRSGAEITVEANPGTLDRPKLDALRQGGATRLSLGVQSFDDALLNALGRIHTAQEAVRSYVKARGAGFDNINLDLMYGLPGQTMAGWRETLAGALSLAPDHLSLYALGVEEETPLYRDIAMGVTPEPDDDLAADMYSLALDALAEAGYQHYEISNWAGQGVMAGERYATCRHNMAYWLDEPYWGVGAGAHGYLRQRRYWNVRHPRDYVQHLQRGELPIEGSESIDRATEISEFMILGLRLMEGIAYRRFADRFGCDLRDAFGDTIRKQTDLGLLEADEQGIRLTERGYLLGNQVFQEFLLTGGE